MPFGKSANFFEFESSAKYRTILRKILANQLAVSADQFPSDLAGVKLDEIGLDSLETVELIMELEEEFGFNLPDDDDNGYPPVSVA